MWLPDIEIVLVVIGFGVLVLLCWTDVLPKKPAKREIDIQACPDRQTLPGPWDGVDTKDIWLDNLWTTDYVHQRIENQEIVRLRKDLCTLDVETAYCWLWDCAPPRVCSFCHCIHPLDALKLVRDGWELELTGEVGRRYLFPPGTRQRTLDVLKGLSDGSIVEKAEPPIWKVFPAVQINFAHWTERQKRELERLIYSHKH